jgi:uncharacterized protein (TIGR02996 family)
MTQEEAFLQAILENPNDDTPRLIYADWLDERGIPHADTIRSHPELFHLVTGLRTANEASVEVLDKALRSQQLRFLAAIFYVLERCRAHIAPLPDWMSDDLDMVLARTPGMTFVRTLLSVLRIWPHEVEATRKLASQLAGCQPHDLLLSALEEHSDEPVFELWACTLQELVLRGGHLEGLPVVERFLKKMQGQNHPLRRLPLHLVEAEQGLENCLPQYSPTSSWWPTLFGPSQTPAGSPLRLTAARPLPVWSGTNDVASIAELQASVQMWGEESSGCVEAQVFRVASPLTSDDLSVPLLQEMRLDCLAGARDIRAKRISLREVISLLFRAAADGGAYTRGVKGAYGRFAMWRSIAALAGAAPSEDIEIVARLAERCVWVYFDAASDWFHQLAWDLGVMALRPDGMSLAVLAATDED